VLRFAVCECGRGAGKEADKEGEGKEEEPRASQEDDRSAQELEGIISTLCHLLAVRQRQAQISKSGLEAKLAVHTALEVTLCVSQGQLCSLAFLQLLAAPCLMHLCLKASASHASTTDCPGQDKRHGITCPVLQLSTILTYLTRPLCFVVWVCARGC
jgi:hypothetical protein